jgi:hypothetical protein
MVNAEKHRDRYCELSATDTECLLRDFGKFAKTLASDIVDANTRGVGFAEAILVLQGIVRFDKTAAASPTCSTRDLANLHSSECLYPAGHNKRR